MSHQDHFENEHNPDPPRLSGDGTFDDEGALVVAAQGGDHTAFEKLYERYNDRICRYLCRMVGNDGIGCELTQDTFTRAWERLLQLQDPTRFVGWLYRIATNLAWTYQDKVRHHPVIPLNEYTQQYQEQLSVAGPERQVEEAELLRIALAQVSKTYRPCLILYFVEELSQRQIASVLHMKESCVSKYVCRGKEDLRRIYKCLASESVDSFAGKGPGL